MPSKPTLCRWLTTLLLALAVMACSRDPALDVVRNTTDATILPLHREFADAASDLSDAAKVFCEGERNPAGFDKLRQQWRQTVTAWSGVQIFQLGPITEDNRAWRLQFWPDLKDQTARKLIQLLKSDQAISEEAIHQASVIIQGLSALEVLLFDSRWGQPTRYERDADLAERQCQLLQAIADNSARVASDIWQGWHVEGGNFSGQFTHPGEENLLFPDSKSALAALADTLVFTVEQLKIKKLKRALGLDGHGQGNPYRLEWWRSASAELAIASNLRAMQSLFIPESGSGLYDLLKSRPGGSQLADDIRTHLELALQQLDALPASLAELAASGERPEALQNLYQHLQTLEGLLGEQLPALLGITLSFNANDGD